MIYLGTPGRMVGIACPAEQRLDTAERYSFQTTLEGRVKAQVRPKGARVWDLRLPRTSTPSEVATLAAFANGSWGPGPFWFISADAPVVNLLSPEGADAKRVFTNGSEQGGPVELPGVGWVSASLLQGSATNLRFQDDLTPVLQGTPVTGSVWVRGSGSMVGLSFYTADGTWVSNILSDAAGGPDWVPLSITTLPPDTAASVRLFVRESVQATRPALTWTGQVYEWGDGQGCAKAVVLGGQRDLIQALDTPTRGRYSDYAFTVQEVG